MILNASQIKDDIRDSLNEATASHWTDLAILRKMNKAQQKLAMLLSMSIGDWLMTKAAITPSNSLVALPSDCAKPIYMENATTGMEVQFSGTIRERNLSRVDTVLLNQLNPDAYMYGNYVEINQASYTDQVNLWYEKRIPDLHFGTGASGSGSSALVFTAANIPAPRDDYYNNVYVTITAGTGVGIRSLISDYTGATFTATITGTVGTDSIYGTETLLPEEAIPCLTNMAATELLAKPGAAIDPKYFDYIKTELKDSLAIFTDWLSTRVKNSQRIRTQEDLL